MKRVKNMLEFQTRRVQSGKNVRKFIVVLGFLFTASVIIFDRDSIIPLIPVVVMISIINILLINFRLFYDQRELDRLLQEKNKNTSGE